MEVMRDGERQPASQADARPVSQPAARGVSHAGAQPGGSENAAPSTLERTQRQQHAPRSHAIHARVRSFSRAGGRLTESQHAAIAEFGERYVVEVPRADAIRTVDPTWRMDPTVLFGHPGQERPLLIEVGSGGGEAILVHAAAHPEMDHLAVEVWETAIAKIVRDAAKAGIENVRVVPADASQLLATALPIGCAAEVWTFFPDPWRKARHRKRRLVTESFADAVARVLGPGGRWRLATDWADYAWQMRDVLEAVSAAATLGSDDLDVGHGTTNLTARADTYFACLDAGARADLGSATWIEGDLGNGPDPGSPSGIYGGWSERYEGRVLTRFEQRGIDEGRTIRDLTAVRTDVPYRSDVE